MKFNWLTVLLQLMGDSALLVEASVELLSQHLIAALAISNAPSYVLLPPMKPLI